MNHSKNVKMSKTTELQKMMQRKVKKEMQEEMPMQKKEIPTKMEKIEKQTSQNEIPQIEKKPSTLHLSYNVIKTTINKDSIEDLVIVNPRKIHISQVNSIYKSLYHNKHFDSPFVVNIRDGVTRIIDGNHRVDALKRYFKHLPLKSIDVFFATYENLTDKEEREVFTRWNISVTQSTDDFINSYKEVIPTYSRFVSEMPCSVYGSYNKMKMRDLINAYSASFGKPYSGGESRTKINFIQYVQNLTDSDVDKIIKNFKIIKTVFDGDNKKDWRNQAAFKNIIFRALYCLVANNVNPLGEEYVIRRMRVALANRTLLDEYRRYSGRRASVDAYHAFKSILNNTPSDKKFK